MIAVGAARARLQECEAAKDACSEQSSKPLTHTYTHTHTHTQTQTQTQTHRHTNTQTHRHTDTHSTLLIPSKEEILGGSCSAAVSGSFPLPPGGCSSATELHFPRLTRQELAYGETCKGYSGCRGCYRITGAVEYSEAWSAGWEPINCGGSARPHLGGGGRPTAPSLSCVWGC